MMEHPEKSGESMRFELDVPFFENTEDNTHCYQACLKMGLAYVLPDEKFSFRQLDALTEYTPNGSWPLAGIAWLRRNGMEAFFCSSFDYPRYIREPFEYLSEKFGFYQAILMRECGDIEWTVRQTRRYIDACGWIPTMPVQYDLKNCLRRNYAVICSLATDIICGADEGNGHAVIVKGFTDELFIVHDPGLPAQPNFPISFALFEKAWANPNHRAKEFIAFKAARPARPRRTSS